MKEKIKEILNNVVTKLNKQERAKRSDSDKREYFYASDSGGCPRSIFFAFQGAQENELDAKTIRVFQNGNSVHDRLTGYFKEAGILIDSEQDIPRDELNIHGRYDAKIKIDNEEIIAELKSINMRTMMGPLKHHIEQLMIYLHYSKIQKGVLIYESKQTQELFIYPVEYDEEKANKLLNWFKETKGQIDSKETPKIPFAYSFGKYPCSYCKYRTYCQDNKN